MKRRKPLTRFLTIFRECTLLLLLLGSTLCTSLIFVAPATGHSQWTQWRGPQRNGSVPDSVRKGEWLPQAIMLWQREVGEGYSGPIIEGDRIWVQTRQGGEEIIYSVTLDSGKTVWSQRYMAPFKQDPTAIAHGLGPFSTPALANGRLFTFSITSVLSVWDAYKGTLLWRKEYSEEFKPSYPLYGTAASPLVWGDRCFVAFGASGNEGVEEKGAMVALRVSDGKEIWRWDGDGPALAASPVIAAIEGAPQLVSKTEDNIVGWDPETGKELWRIPFKVTQDNTIVMPLILGNRLLTSDPQKGFSAWQIHRKGESFDVQKLWTNDAVSLDSCLQNAGEDKYNNC